MRPLIAAALLAAALPGAAVAEPAAPDPGSSVETLLPEVLDLRLAESVIPLEEEERAGARTTIRISSDVLFEFDSATLTPEAKTHLVRLAGRLEGREAEVEGFTDSLGAPAYNRALSQRRADAVKAELVRLGVTGVTAKGYGEARPVAPNEVGGKDDPAGRAKNRRVELVFGS